MKITIITLTLFLAICCLAGEYPFFQDILHTGTGREIRGEVERITADSIELVADDDTLIFGRGDVVLIEFGKARPGDWWRTTADVDDSVLIEILENLPDSEKFAGADYVVLYDAHDITVGGNGAVQYYHREVCLVLSEGVADDITASELDYFPDVEEAVIVHARSISSTGEISHIDNSQIECGPVNTSFPEYDRLWSLKYALGKVSAGSIIDIATIAKTRSEPLNPAAYTVFFRDEEPVLHKEVVLRMEVGAPVHFAELNWPAKWRKSSLYDQGYFVVLTWARDDIPPIIREPDMPPDEACIPLLEVCVGGDWKRTNSAFIAAMDSAEANKGKIDELAARLVENWKNDREKASAIYNWVIKKIRFVPVNAMDYRFAPKKVSDILESQSANNLDRAFLFYTIAKAAGLNAKMGFATTHNIAFRDNLPTLANTPKPVVRLNLEGEIVWAELSSEYRPLGILPDEIMGEKAVVFSEDGPEIVKIPLPTPKEEHIEEIIKAKLTKKGDLKGTITIIYRGSHQAKIRKYEQFGEDEIQREMEKRIGMIHPDAELRSWKLLNTDDLNKAPEMVIEFEIKGYAVIAEDKSLSFALPDINYMPEVSEKSPREWPLWFGSPRRETRRIELELPRGYEVYNLPNDTASFVDAGRQATPSISYSAAFEMANGKLIFFDDYRRARIAIPAKMAPVYQECCWTQALVASSRIVLKKR